MFKIVRKKELNSAVTLLEIEAPFIAKKAKAGQFIIFRIDEKGERVPLTIAGYTLSRFAAFLKDNAPVGQASTHAPQSAHAAGNP